MDILAVSVVVASHQATSQLVPHRKECCHCKTVPLTSNRLKLCTHAPASAEYFLKCTIWKGLKWIWPFFSEPGLIAKYQSTKGVSASSQPSLHGMQGLLEEGAFPSPRIQCILMQLSAKSHPGVLGEFLFAQHFAAAHLMV